MWEELSKYTISHLILLIVAIRLARMKPMLSAESQMEKVANSHLYTRDIMLWNPPLIVYRTMSFHYGIESIPLYSDKTDKVQNENWFFKIWELKKPATDYCNSHIVIFWNKFRHHFHLAANCWVICFWNDFSHLVWADFITGETSVTS